MAASLEAVGELIRGSENTVALTGAGISKSTGIPTFRDLDDGLWVVDEESVQWAYLTSFHADTPQWYEKFWKLYDTIHTAQPSPAHYALRDMVQASLIDTLVTQNIDGLDSRAGTDESKIIEVHGNDQQLHCTGGECGYWVPTADWLHDNKPDGLPPTCLRDGRMLRPDVLMMDENVGYSFIKGLAAIGEADALLVIGTSLEIPAWQDAVRTFAVTEEKPTVVINPHESYADDYTDLVFHASADEILPALRTQVMG